MSHHFSLLIVLLIVCLLSLSVHSAPVIIITEQTCGVNSFWTPFGTDCPPNCQNGGVPPPCIKMFIPSCQCLGGFVFRAGKSGDCIRLAECALEHTRLAASLTNLAQ